MAMQALLGTPSERVAIQLSELVANIARLAIIFEMNFRRYCLLILRSPPGLTFQHTGSCCWAT